MTVTLGEIKAQVLALFDEYSVDGLLIGSSENMDYINRIPMLVNVLQMEWCRLIKIEEMYTVIQPQIETLYTMPADFMEIDRIIKVDFEDCYINYYWKDRKTLKLKATDDGSYDIHYFKYPIKLDNDSLDTTILEICDEASYIIAFKIASIIIQSEKADISARLLQIYENEKSMLISNHSNMPQFVQTVYSM